MQEHDCNNHIPRSLSLHQGIFLRLVKQNGGNEVACEGAFVPEESIADSFVSREDVGAVERFDGYTIEMEFAQILAEAGSQVEELRRGRARTAELGEKSRVLWVQRQAKRDEPKLANAGPGKDLPRKITLRGRLVRRFAISASSLPLRGDGAQRRNGFSREAYDVEDVWFRHQWGQCYCILRRSADQ